jgi:hypothetical protein
MAHRQGEAEWPGSPTHQSRGLEDISELQSWSSEKLAQYFNARGYKDYDKMWSEHRVNGERVGLLTAPDIEKMGVKRVGDRLGIQKELRKLKRVVKAQERNKTIAEHKMAYDGSCCGWNMEYCCGLLPWEPDHYVLTSSVLKIKSYEIGRLCGTLKCKCLGSTWNNNTIRLDRIVDCDDSMRVAGVGCCAENKCEVTIAVQAGTAGDESDARTEKHTMLLDSDEGVKFAQLIREASEDWREYLNGHQDA